MRVARTGALGLCLPLLAAALGASPVGDAVTLFGQKRYAEAKAALEPIVASEPSNAEASYYLGMSLLRLGGPSSLDTSRPWLAKAAKLEPENEGYLADYAGVCLLLADRDSSFSLALEGRDAMTRAIAANPGDLAACEGLMRFYARAPWPLGDTSRAFEMVAYVSTKDPKRAAKDYRELADTLRKSGHADQAEEAAKLAQSLAPAPAH